MTSAPWYVNAFRSDYAKRYAHRDEAEAKANIRAILNWFPVDPTARILDLACGAGRHLIALHQAGLTRLTGLDLSRDLLDLARNRLQELGITKVQLIRGDMRAIGIHNRFDAVFSFFSSFGYFANDQTNTAVIGEIAAALKTGGAVLIDTMNPPHVRATLVAEETLDIDGRHVNVSRRITTDNRVEKTVVVHHNGARCRETFESVRLYDGEEMTHMLENAGFADIRLAGALDGRTYSASTPRLIVAATLGESDA